MVKFTKQARLLLYQPNVDLSPIVMLPTARKKDVSNSPWRFSMQELLWLVVSCALLANLAWLEWSALFWAVPIVLGALVAWRLEGSIGAVLCAALSALFWILALSIPAIYLAWNLTERGIPFTISMFATATIIGGVSGYLGACIERSRTRSSD